MARGRYRRQREYPQPPPPSKNNTATMIIKVSVDMPHLAPCVTSDCSLAFVSSASRSHFTMMKTAGTNISLPFGICLPPGIAGILRHGFFIP